MYRCKNLKEEAELKKKKKKKKNYLKIIDMIKNTHFNN